ncbi:MAG: hypothetical protein KAX19_02620, partial [Candidatus Brocadiae bacterium]|nr:hypothetical protein [Candidatus Brocadiia bacterium]
ARGAVNAVAAYGEHEKWAAMAGAWGELEGVTGRFEADREIQLELATGALLAALVHRAVGASADADRMLTVLRQLAARFPDDDFRQLLAEAGG